MKPYLSSIKRLSSSVRLNLVSLLVIEGSWKPVIGWARVRTKHQNKRINVCLSVQPVTALQVSENPIWLDPKKKKKKVTNLSMLDAGMTLDAWKKSVIIISRSIEEGLSSARPPAQPGGWGTVLTRERVKWNDCLHDHECRVMMALPVPPSKTGRCRIKGNITVDRKGKDQTVKEIKEGIYEFFL